MERKLMKGNEALAEAAIRAGCKCFFGYPITPQTEISAYMSKRMPKIGGVFLQAESEVSAINMVYGCAGTGIRCMTSSSSPGISLKSEGVSYIAGADLPCVIINVMRGGPGLGGIQPSQADYWQATKALGHGGKRVHNISNSLYLKPDELEARIVERYQRYDEIKAKHTEAECYLTDDADIVITAYGSVARIAKAAVDAARKQGIKVGLFRPITLWPFPEKELKAACANADNVLCVEMSMGQMVEDVKLALECKKNVEFFGRTGGIIPKPAEILAKIVEMTQKGAK